MARGILIPLDGDRKNAIPGRKARGQNAFLWGGAGYHNTDAPDVGVVEDLTFPASGNAVVALHAYNANADAWITAGTGTASYKPQDMSPWSQRRHGSKEWAHGWPDGDLPADDTDAPDAETWIVVNVTDNADVVARGHADDRVYFLEGTIVEEGTFAECVSYIAANY